MTHGDMPLGWGWFSKYFNKNSKYLVVRVGTKRCLYQDRDGCVCDHSVIETDSVPSGKTYPHFFLPVGLV